MRFASRLAPTKKQMTSSLIPSRNAPSKAVALLAKASTGFATKLAETKTLLQRAAAEYAPVTQASSLGAEDVVITHLINSLQLDIPVFVLETGALHTETLALLERTQAGLADYAFDGMYQPRLLMGQIGSHARALGGALLPLHSQFFPDKNIFLKRDKV
jgi:hypothetical protein